MLSQVGPSRGLIALSSEKGALRLFWKNVRAAIPESRRAEASAALCEAFKVRTGVLSYAGFNHELCTEALNKALIETGQLYLPRVSGNNLEIYQVDQPEEQLACNRWGLKEPIPERCRRVLLSQISLVLVPGLAFDSRNHRLGYGKGCYDRFLPQLPVESEVFGVAYREQHSEELLPLHERDFPLKATFYT